MKKQQTRLRPVERKHERLKQRGYFACMQPVVLSTRETDKNKKKH